MAETEKITINLSVVDLGRIDLLVDQGHFSNRTDLIRNAIRMKLNSYEASIEEVVAKRAMAVGVLAYSKVDLEKRLGKGEMMDFSIMGMLILAKDISPELAVATIKSVTVLGVFRASDEVKAALADRIH
jgi:Arc/MetJ-type ribon-helix-helix transcriptional regulator